MNKKKAVSMAVAFICVIVIAGLIYYLVAERKNYSITRIEDISKTEDIDVLTVQPENNNDAGKPYSRDSFDGSITYKGERYEVNSGIDTVLFLGINNSDQTKDVSEMTDGGRSDSLILFIIDNNKELITPLEINRDTMVQVDIYDNDGKYLTHETEQLAIQYSYGKSTRQACNLTKEKVSDLLCHRRIDGVISLTMDGVAPIVDAIGGVNLRLETDETQIDSSYVKGAVIHLDAAAAMDFVQLRDGEMKENNIEQMSRQTQFLIALFQNIKLQGDSIIEKMEEAGEGYIYKDVDADSVDHLSEYDYAEEILTLPGKNTSEGIRDEFYLDEYKLTEMVLDLFFVKVVK